MVDAGGPAVSGGARRQLLGVVHDELALLPEPRVDPHGGVSAHDGGVPPGASVRRLQVVQTTRRRSRRSCTTPAIATGFFGKYLDSYQHDALDGVRPAGLGPMGGLRALRSSSTTASRSTGPCIAAGVEPEDYSTDVLAAHTEGFIRNTEGPVFALFAPAAPHAPAIPAPADEEGFGDLPAVETSLVRRGRTAPTSRAHIQAIHPIGPERTAGLEVLRRNQYRSLQAVDRAVGRILGALEDTGRLDDALVIFTSDNGLLWGEHRWLKKEVPVRGGDPRPAGRARRRDRRGRANATTISSPTSTWRRRSRTWPASTLPGAEGESLRPAAHGNGGRVAQRAPDRTHPGGQPDPHVLRGTDGAISVRVLRHG